MKKNKYIANIVAVSILLIASISMYLCYSNIHNTAVKNRDVQYGISTYAEQHIDFYNYVIDLNLKKQANTDTNLDQYVQRTGEDQYDYIERFYNTIDDEKQQFIDQKEFQYYAINTKTNQVDTNSQDKLSNVNTDDTLKDKYQWYIQYRFDSSGTKTVEFSSNGHDFLRFDQNNNFFSAYSYTDDYGSVNIENPKDLTITYAVEKNIQSDTLNYWIGSNTSSDYLRFSFVYVLFISFIVFMITLITPYKYLEKISFLNFLALIKFEIMSFIWWPLIFFIGRISYELIYITKSGGFTEMFNELGISSIQNYLLPILNIGFWVIFFLLIMLFAFMIRYLFHKGLKRYFKENTCIGWIILNTKKVMDFVINFDLNNQINRSVLRIVVFNFVIISIVSVFFVFGIFFAFVYSVIIFILLKKKFTEIKDDYQVLLNAARSLSDGNFDIQINEDIGIFNPLKEEFSHIKDGFQKAVTQEVKSQKMKTELISNVSHDLKTPLTSIITYVDLLKNDQLTLEEKNNYLQILERNSLRLKNLIDDLFEVSKANSGDIKLDFVEVDIIALIKQAQFECMDKLEEKDLDIRSSFDQEKIICLLDSSKTYRIFENLFINMSKYSLSHTRVYIEVKDLADRVEIIFKNISADEMNFKEHEIVERFVQGDKSRNTSGSGLGLAIVKSFTELQHGQFNVEIDGDLFKSIIEFKKQL